VNPTEGRLLFGLAGHQSKNNLNDNLNDKQVMGAVQVGKGEQSELIENFIVGPK
jgi:hypothetical protein